jgi:hypothetical protein
VTTVRETVIWGAIVGIALGALLTFALAHGLFSLPWESTVADAPARTLARPQGHAQDGASPASILPGLRATGVEPRRPARPTVDRSLAAVAPTDHGLTRS